MDTEKVWYVVGESDGGIPALFKTKEAAEAYARYVFPEERPADRHARVYSRPLWTLEDVKEM
jgi:hypothetical protein